ncbi:hypothetical protein PFISCL1PPCAC_20760, partial [Pristionchus fissidentatus]
RIFRHSSTQNLYILRCDETTSKIVSSCISSMKFQEFISVVCHAQSFSEYILPTLIKARGLEKVCFSIAADMTLDNPSALSAAIHQLPKVHKVRLSLENIRINSSLYPSADEIAVDDSTLMHLVKNSNYTSFEFTECSGRGIIDAFEIYRCLPDFASRYVEVTTRKKFADDLEELVRAHPNIILHFDNDIRKVFKYDDKKTI